MVRIVKCPIETAFYRTSIGKKWTLTIIRDLLFGTSNFSDFLKTNPGLSSKVLAERLKEMIDDGVVEKTVVSESPLDIQYSLTQKGRDLNRVLYELSLFGAKYYPEVVFEGEIPDFHEMIEIFGRGFKLPDNKLEIDHRPEITIFEDATISSD
jgi:DNA-binding HxlR family transcriptional regulator